VITDENRKAFEQLTQFIETETVPLRFTILAGETLHHLRSVFDHLAWQLSSADFQAKPAAAKIEFPVFSKAPKLCGVTKNEMCSYCRKVEGIDSPTALARIDSLQPHRRTNPLRDPLFLIHDMDKVDKHRELVLTVHSMKLSIKRSARAFGYVEQMPWEIGPRTVRLAGPPKMQMDIEMSAQISLGELRGREDEPIIPTLNSLLRFTRYAVESFAEEFA
ncbi:MAG: hypothetical protein ACRD3Q_15680, partial [Terriglobales bacterium]